MTTSHFFQFLLLFFDPAVIQLLTYLQYDANTDATYNTTIYITYYTKPFNCMLKLRY